MLKTQSVDCGKLKVSEPRFVTLLNRILLHHGEPPVTEAVIAPYLATITASAVAQVGVWSRQPLYTTGRGRGCHLASTICVPRSKLWIDCNLLAIASLTRMT